jgi:photosystem II stability/assembly factor-like uncharacterized protein
MKKLLLFIAIIINMTASAQNFWTEVGNIFTDPSYITGEISIVDSNVIWVNGRPGYNIGSSQDYVRQWSKSNDGGLTWTSGNYNFLPTNSNVVVGAIKAISLNTAYVTTYNALGTVTANLGVWITIDGGTSWTKQASADFSNPASFANFVHFFDADNGIVIGDPVNGQYEIYTTTNGGANWVLLPPANIPMPLINQFGGVEEYAFPELYEVVGNVIWFGTSSGRIFKSLDKGLSWTVSQSPLNSFTSCCSGGTDSGNFSFKNQNEGILRDGNFNYFKSFDGGTTWNSINSQGTIRDYKACFVPNTLNTVFQFGKDIFNNIFGSSYSTDGGNNWINLDNVGTSPVIPYSVKFQSGTTGFCIGRYVNPTLNTLNANGQVQPKFFRLTDPLQRLNGNALANNMFESNSKVSLYPNPTTGTIAISGNAVSNISITDVLGKEVLNQKYNKVDNVVLNIESFQNGIYFAKIVDGSNENNIVKIVKQ